MARDTLHRDGGRPHDPYSEAIASLPLQAPPDPADDDEPRAAGRGAVPWATVAIILAVLPLVVAGGALVLRFGDSYHPVADYATNQARSSDVGRYEVLTGPYSRDNWSHPGPALFYLMAVPFQLSGGSSLGLPLGALVVNGLAVVGMALVARRVGGTPLLLLTLLGAGVLVRALGADFLADPWNPYVTVLPFGLLVLLCWAMWTGTGWALPAGAAIASFCAQTHIGFVPLTLPLLGFGALGLVLHQRRAPPAGGRWGRARPFAFALAVLAVMWAPPLWEQLTSEPGNLGQVVLYFRHAPGETHTLAEGVRVVTGQFGLPPEWISGARAAGPVAQHVFVDRAPWPVLLLPLALAVVVLRRRGVAVAWALAATLVVAMGLGVLSVARTVGPAYAYRLRWTWVLAMLAMVVVAWAAWRVLADPGARSRERWLHRASLAALAVLAAVNVVGALDVGVPLEHESDVLAELLPAVEDALPGGDDAVVIRGSSFPGLVYASGLMVALEDRGVNVKTDQLDERSIGSHRFHRDGRVGLVLTVATDDGIPAAARRPRSDRVAYWGLPREDLERRTEELAALDAAARDAGTVDSVAHHMERERVLPAGSAVAVFAAAGGS